MHLKINNLSVSEIDLKPEKLIAGIKKYRVEMDISSNLKDIESFLDLLNSQRRLKTIEEIMQFNSEVWKKKKENSISLKEPISNVKIPSSLKDFESDLVACHNLQQKKLYTSNSKLINGNV